MNARLVARPLCIALCSIVGFTAPNARAATVTNDALPRIAGIHLGFLDHYKLGCWTPVAVDLVGGPSAFRGVLRLVAPDGDGVPTQFTEAAVSLAAGESKTFRLYAKFGRPQAPIRISLTPVDSRAPLTEREFAGDEIPAAMSSAQTLTLELGSPLDLGSAIQFGPDGEPQGAVVAFIGDPAMLPDRWQGYCGVDLIVMTTATRKIYDRVSPAQLDSMYRWLELGGRAILSVGREAPQTIALGKPLARFAPGKFVSVLSLDRFGALENLSGAAVPLDPATGGPRRTIPAAQLEDVQGRVEAFEGSRSSELPLVVRRPVGFGQLTFIAIDLDEPPVSQWPARNELIGALAGHGPRAIATAPAADPRSAGLRLGFDDMIGQLRSSLDQFPGVRLIPFSIVIGLAAAYILLLFPLDYWLSRKRLRSNAVSSFPSPDSRPPTSPAWPWLRFSLIAIVFGAAACAIGWSWTSSDMIVNRVEVVDVDRESGLVRGQSWFSIYSPVTKDYLLELTPNGAAVAERSAAHVETGTIELSWLGLPGNGLGAMKNTPAEAFPFTEPYSMSLMGGSLGPTPIAARSSRCFSSFWTRNGEQLIDADLHEADRQLIGAVRMSDTSSGRSLELTDCVLFYDHWAYKLGRLSVDKVAKLDDPQTIDTLLTQRHMVGDKVQAAMYDPAGLDRRRILEIMLSYKAAGGRGYTSLWNRAAADLDLSDHFSRLGRAVLIGVGPPASSLSIDGQPASNFDAAEALTFYRFVLPVTSSDRAASYRSE